MFKILLGGNLPETENERMYQIPGLKRGRFTCAAGC